jgi:hypothetical protein
MEVIELLTIETEESVDLEVEKTQILLIARST